MIAAFILVLSVVALLQFGIAQWRSIWISIAEQPLSASLQTATGIPADAIGADDFEVSPGLLSNCALLHKSGTFG